MLPFSANNKCENVFIIANHDFPLDVVYLSYLLGKFSPKIENFLFVKLRDSNLNGLSLKSYLCYHFPESEK